MNYVVIGKMNPGKVAEVIEDSEKFYFAIDENGNSLVSKEFVQIGILVNPTRESIIELKNSLSDEEKLKTEQLIIEKNILISRVPKLNAIHLSGEFIEDLKKSALETTLPPGLGPLGTGVCYMTPGVIKVLDKIVAVIDNNPNYDHYMFIVDRE